jgi:hypothetical protein
MLVSHCSLKKRCGGAKFFAAAPGNNTVSQGNNAEYKRF